MYKNITLVAFISAFTLTACGGGSSTADPTGTASSSKALSSSKASSSKSSVASIASSISSASANQDTFSSSSIVASSSSSVIVVPSSSSSAVASVAPSSSSSVVASVKSSSSSSSVKSSSSSTPSSSSSVKSSSSSVVSSSSSVASSSSSVSSFPASIYHVRGTFNDWAEGTLMAGTRAGDVYEFCANFVAGDQANGTLGFKIDPNGAWGNDAFPSADYTVAAGWVKISYNSTTKALTVQQNLPVNCGDASSSTASIISSSSVTSSSVKTSSSVASSSNSTALAITHNAGFNCLNCHKAGGAGSRKVTFTVAGTIMKSDDTPQTNATITFIEAGTNATITLKTDGSGNFYTQQAIAAITTTGFTPTLTTPVQGSIAMGTVTTNGGCNSCHNVDGDVDMRLVRD